MPLGGCALALVFYELIFVKTQDFLNDSEDGDSDRGDKLELDSDEGKKVVEEAE